MNARQRKKKLAREKESHARFMMAYEKAQAITNLALLFLRRDGNITRCGGVIPDMTQTRL